MVMATWDQVGERQRFRISGAVIGVFDRARRRHDARKAARRLLTMDAHILRDIGVSRADVLEMLRNSAG
ncbi:MAG: DUF1127 domain-containing protein [Amaricoccus sp.]